MQTEPETKFTTADTRQSQSHVSTRDSGYGETVLAPAETLPAARQVGRKAVAMLAAADLLAYLLSFSVVLFLKYRGPLSRFLELPLVIGLPFTWGASALLTRKLTRLSQRTFIRNVRAFSLAFFIMLGGISLLVKLFPLAITSRLAIVASLLLGYTLELVMLQSVTPALKLSSKPIRLVKSVLLFGTDLAIFAVAIMAYLLLLVLFRIQVDNLWLLVISAPLGWFVSAVLSHRFELDFEQNYWSYIYNFIKSYFVFACLASFLVLLFRLHGTAMDLFVGGVTGYATISFFVFSTIFFASIPARTDEARIAFLKGTEVSDELVDAAKISRVDIWVPSCPEDDHITFREKLRDVHLSKFPGLFSMIDRKIDLEELNIKYSIVTRTTDPYDVEVLPDGQLQLFLNLQDLNRMGKINSYLAEVNRKLTRDGIFIGRFEPIKNRYNRFLRKYPFYFAQLFYARDFIWHRVIPKLPGLRRFYFAISKGGKRALSIAEALGRLYYSGFALASAFELDGYVYFIALRKTPPVPGRSPFYGPLFRLKRVGKDGKSIYVYKIRTMHPYSEYIQEFVYDANNLEAGGKLKDDFRVTSWGRVLRKLWIDELPMFINFFKGDLKLVGVRPLSGHFLSLYDESLRLRRVKHKPGLVPPFYADLPKTLEEIMESERKYLDAYEKNPVLTDVRYFFKAARNIVVRGARSA